MSWPTHLERWLDSGLPLRRWLVNGLLLHVRNRGIAEARRRARGDAGVGGIEGTARPAAQTAASEPDALRALAPDCTGNPVPDAVEIADGTSADIDGDGVVDGTDLLIVLERWGPCP